MYKAKVNSQLNFEIDLSPKGGTDAGPLGWDLVQEREGKFHIIRDNRSYKVEVLETDYQSKTFTIKVNGNKYTVELKDRYDELLKSLGMDTYGGSKVNEMKAPMPGLVVDVRVKEGDEVRKGDPVLVLEAMKMENILKAPADVTIKKVNVLKGDKVEKNQVLVNFS
jgi:acetyl/propionyl-CoA carboxylase alpha subunit